jgi:uncharacterized membrane protein YfcA
MELTLLGSLELRAAPLAALGVAVVAAYFLKGFSGFGPALIFMPVASVLYGPRLALATGAVADVVVGAALLLALHYTADERRLVARMTVYVALGTVVGASLAGVLPESVLLAFIAIVVFVLGVRLWLLADRRVPGALIASRSMVAGFVGAGVSGGLTGISGPFVVAGASQLDKGAFRRLLVAVFFVEAIVKIVVYGATGIPLGEVFTLFLAIAPFVAIGLGLGAVAHIHVSQRRFFRVLGVVLVALSIETVVALAR